MFISSFHPTENQNNSHYTKIHLGIYKAEITIKRNNTSKSKRRKKQIQMIYKVIMNDRG